MNSHPSNAHDGKHLTTLRWLFKSARELGQVGESKRLARTRHESD